MKRIIVTFVVFMFQFGIAQELVVEPAAPGKNLQQDENTLYASANVEVKPEFPGGVEKFYEYVEKNFNKPTSKDFPGGKVYVSFVVETDGSLTGIKVVRNMGYGTAEEAVRVVKKGPKWIPAKHNGKNVRCQYMIPIKLAAN